MSVWSVASVRRFLNYHYHHHHHEQCIWMLAKYSLFRTLNMHHISRLHRNRNQNQNQNTFGVKWTSSVECMRTGRDAQKSLWEKSVGLITFIAFAYTHAHLLHDVYLFLCFQRKRIKCARKVWKRVCSNKIPHHLPIDMENRFSDSHYSLFLRHILFEEWKDRNDPKF